jgi:hypothetical protein
VTGALSRWARWKREDEVSLSFQERARVMG